MGGGLTLAATVTREIGQATALTAADALPSRAWIQQMLVANLTERATQTPLPAVERQKQDVEFDCRPTGGAR